MKRKSLIVVFSLLLFSFSEESAARKHQKAVLNPIPFNQVELNDAFWAPRLKLQKEVLVPFAFNKAIPAIDNLCKTAHFLKGIPDELPFAHRYVASDLYKIMEGAAYLLQLERDSKLEQKMDSIIDFIADAQEADGYLYESHTTGVSKNHAAWGGAGMGDKPYSWVLHSHELYNMGHMYEGAIAYYQATGKDKWLKVAIKNADHINKVFFKGDSHYNNGKPVNQAPGHQELELALVKLFRATGEKRYLEMAKRFLDIRAVTYRPEGNGVMAPEYAQQHLPVARQTKAVGHAVRATYMYAAMADVVALTGNADYQPALDSIWNNIVDTRMHITGGLGAIHGIEGFGPEYELPNKEAYNETCAAVGNVLFNYRMFLMEKDARYIDVAEIALYNNVLAGVNLDGNKFFYVNPLEADGITPFNHGKPGRSPWFGTACCPSNIARLIPQLSGMIYATSENNVYCGFYAGNHTQLQLMGGKVNLQQKTNYPIEEQVEWIVTPEQSSFRFALHLRIPTWTQHQFLPGKLYHYTQTQTSAWEVLVNGEYFKAEVLNGFIVIDRKWKQGDKVLLTLPMPLRTSVALSEVVADRDRLCVTRGPLVYCAESADQPNILPNVFIDQEIDGTQSIFSDGICRGIPYADVPMKEKIANGTTRSQCIRLLPYYAWNNRGDGAMMVWFPTSNSSAPYVNVKEMLYGKYEKIEASHTFENDQLAAVGDNQFPKSSSDTNLQRWTSWPQVDKKQWIEITLNKPTDIISISIYWYDDRGGVQLPKEWSIEYESNGVWKPFELYVTDQYALQKDQFNMVHPARQLVIQKFRINMMPQDHAAVGILEVLVDGK